jgi:hypothetical protein
MDGGRSRPPSTKWSQNVACDHRPGIVYIAMLIQGLSTSAHVGRMAHVRARPCRGWGGGYCGYPYPSQVQSRHVMPHLSPTCSLQKILSKQVLSPPFTFGCNLRPGFASPCARAGPKNCCFRNWRGRPSRWASQSSAPCRPPPGSLPRSPQQSYSLPTPQLNVPGSPHIVILHTQAVGMKSLQAAVQPADLAPFPFNCWWSTDWSHVICKCYNFLLWSHFLFGNYNSLSDTGHVLVKTIINWLVTCSAKVL